MEILTEGGVAPLAIASYVEVDDPEVSDAEWSPPRWPSSNWLPMIGATVRPSLPRRPSSDDAAARRLSIVAERLEAFPGVVGGPRDARLVLAWR